jgi:hypothetical protein
MKGTFKRNLAFLLSVILVLTAIDHYHFSAQAENSYGIEYVQDDEGAMVATIIGNEDVSGNTIVVEEGYVLEIKGPITKDSMTIKAGGLVVICDAEDESTVGSFAGQVNAEEGAAMTLQSADHAPSGVILYDASGEAPFDEEGWAQFFYDGSKWVHQPWGEDPEPDSERLFVVHVDGMVSTSNFSAEYSLNDEDYYPLEIHPNDNLNAYQFEFEITDPNWEPDQHIWFRIGDVDSGTPRHVLRAFSIGDVDWFTSVGETVIVEYEHPESQSHRIFVALGYENQGLPGIMDAAKDYIYGYATDDVDLIKELLSIDLYHRLIEVPMYENFDIYDPWELRDHRIEPVGSPYELEVIPALEEDGDTRVVRNFKVTWGVDQDTGNPVTSTIPVIQTINHREYLVCTDFDGTTGWGTTFYSFVAHRDEVQFSEEDSEHAYSCVIYTDLDQVTGLNAGGNGCEMWVLNSDGLYTIQVNTSHYWSHPDDREEGYSYNYNDYGYDLGSFCRILEGSETYVVIETEGDSKTVGGLGPRGLQMDNIYRTGESGEEAEGYVFIGESTMYLEPLNLDPSATEITITEAVVTDPTMAAGAHVTITETGKLKFVFDSNFYDTIPVRITFSDGSVKNITIHRIGLVINFGYLMAPNVYPYPDHGTLGQDYLGGPDVGPTFNYDYDGGEQVIVYATYYHPTYNEVGRCDDLYLSIEFTDGSRRIISPIDTDHNFDGSWPEGIDTAACTSFIIGFDEGKEFDGNVYTTDRTDFTYHEGGFYATVLNAGYDSTTRYGGTQTGSGKGVYWDGHIYWNN